MAASISECRVRVLRDLRRLVLRFISGLYLWGDTRGKRRGPLTLFVWNGISDSLL